MGDSVGTVATLSRFPVKSMQGERVAEAEVTDRGILGDRAYALVETETGKVLSGKSPGVGALLLRCQAEFVTAPEPGNEVAPVRVTLPDGTTVTTDARDADAALSGFLERGVTLQRAATDDDEHRDAVTTPNPGAAFLAQAGMSSPLPNGSFLDLFPVSVLTTSTLARLQALRPESRFDARRFRMNVVVDTPDDGFVENGWIGRSLHIGDSVRLAIVLSDPRCVMTTLAQDELPKDNGILQTLVRHNRLEVADGLYPCAGVYAVVEVTGTTRVGDRVTLV